MREYEALIILNPDLQGDALKIALNEILDVLKKHQCDVENVDEWGVRPLTHNIAKKKEGFYYLVKFKGEPKGISEIRKSFSLNENILSSMITVRKQEKTASPKAAGSVDRRRGEEAQWQV